MRKKITVKEFFASEEKLCINCNTEEKAIKLLDEFDWLGYKWRDGIPYNTCNYWDVYKEKSCYNNKRFCGHYNFHLDSGYKIYAFDDVIFEKPKKETLEKLINRLLKNYMSLNDTLIEATNHNIN